MALTKVTGSGADGLNLSSTDVTISSGDLLFATANKGVVLGVTSNTDSNTLDDYEEGTWTPAINNGSSDLGTSGIVATYTKIGRTVYAEFQIQRNDSSSDTNFFKLAGLPFTSINGPRLAGQAWIDNSSGDIKCFMYLGSSSTSASFKKTGDNDSSVSINEFSNSRYVYGALVYNT